MTTLSCSLLATGAFTLTRTQKVQNCAHCVLPAVYKHGRGCFTCSASRGCSSAHDILHRATVGLALQCLQRNVHSPLHTEHAVSIPFSTSEVVLKGTETGWLTGAAGCGCFEARTAVSLPCGPQVAQYISRHPHCTPHNFRRVQ
jgi:hypothetical protein